MNPRGDLSVEGCLSAWHENKSWGGAVNIRKLSFNKTKFNKKTWFNKRKLRKLGVIV